MFIYTVFYGFVLGFVHAHKIVLFAKPFGPYSHGGPYGIPSRAFIRENSTFPTIHVIHDDEYAYDVLGKRNHRVPTYRYEIACVLGYDVIRAEETLEFVFGRSRNAFP